MQSDRDPIAAIATAPGRGGIGIVRVSGRDIDAIVRGVLGEAGAHRLEPRRAQRARFLDEAGRAIDDGIALFYGAPHSYTGENVLELQGHGGPVVLRLLLARCLEAGAALGARVAAPGEFTRRAFLNERLDLAQAEAVADLIEAGTAAAARGAARALQGELSQAADALVGELSELRALTEASLDFPDEEIDLLRAADAAARLDRASAVLDALRRRARQGALLQAGARVALVGAPNVGKSSLLNALAGADVAIVTEVPGTTRDRIERLVEIEGVPFEIVDTAGLRATGDPVERAGIERALAAAAGADIVLEISDARAHAHEPRKAAPGLEVPVLHLAPGATHVPVHNKIDLTTAPAGVRDGVVHVSARSGAGLDALRTELLRVAGWEGAGTGDGAILARERHLQALDRAADRLTAARAHVAEHAPRLELMAEELRLAALALGEISGALTSDELLGLIFSRFCIGK